jgi:hypothetical protein
MTESSEGMGAHEAVDAVVAWVDGDDPKHRAKLDRHLATIGRRPPSARPTRFRSVAEVDYCITSILRFAPFVRRIHVITDEQRPPIFAAAERWSPTLRDKLVLVDHREAFAGYEDCLPNFNSLSIATVLYRIPGLAERFVYFNDDVMLIKPITVQEFFHDGVPVLRGQFEPLPERRFARRVRALWRKVSMPAPGAVRAGVADAQARAAQMAGFDDRFLHMGHNPHPVRRETLERFFESHEDVLRRNLSFPLRDASQFSAVSLANHLELRAHSAVVVPDDASLYLKPASGSNTMSQVARAENDPRKIFTCIQSLDEADEPMQQQVLGWLDRSIGRNPPA